MKPDDADYGITINFKRGRSDPVKVFEAMAKAISGFKEIDRLLLGAADPDLKPVMVLENVEAASITSWVRNKISAVDDEALKELNAKKQIGKYAVKAKYRVLKYLDQKVADDEAARLELLLDDLYKLASRNPVGRALPLPNRIAIEDLVKPMDKIQDAKRLLPHSDALLFKANGDSYELDKSRTKKPSNFVDKIVKDSQGEMEMILTIRKPDLLGSTQWEFKHGSDALYAHMEDNDWLQSFHDGDINITSGSSIECTVAYKYEYDENGQLASKAHDVIKVHKVIPPQHYEQQDMLS